ncbi:hypothetical protein ACTA71_005331 [Dictyostelium dimigraforme]
MTSLTTGFNSANCNIDSYLHWHQNWHQYQRNFEYIAINHPLQLNSGSSIYYLQNICDPREYSGNESIDPDNILGFSNNINQIDRVLKQQQQKQRRQQRRQQRQQQQQQQQKEHITKTEITPLYVLAKKI